MLAAVGMTSLAAPMSAFADVQVANTADKSIVKNISYTTFDNKTARKGDAVMIRVDFKEDFKNQIKPGDKLVFTLPDQLKGVNTTIPLEKNGKGIFGNVVITNGQAVLEFNEKVKAYDHIEGFFEIGTRVIETIPENGKINVPMNLGTSLNVQMLELVNPVGGHNPNPLGYKGGQQNLDNPMELDWFVNLNSTNSRILSDMTVTDTLGKGHKLDMGSMRWHDGKFTEKSLNEAVSDGDIRVEYMNETGFKVVFPADKAYGTLKYKTIINEKNRKQKEMKNYFKIEAVAEGHEERVWEGPRSIKNVLALDGGIDGDQFEEHADEEIQEMPEEHTDEIKSEDVKQIDGTEVQDETHKVDTNVPLTLQETQLLEETLNEEQFDILDEVLNDHANVDVEENHTHNIDVNGESMILTDTELIEEILDPEQIEILTEILEEHLDVDLTIDETQKAKDSTPLVLNFGEVVEENVPVEEVDVLDVITPKPTPAPKASEKPVKKPEAKKVVEPKQKATDKKSTKKTSEPKQKTENKKSVKTTETKTENNSAKKSKNKSEALPNTGSVNNIALTLIGFLGLVAAAFAMIRRNK